VYPKARRDFWDRTTTSIFSGGEQAIRLWLDALLVRPTCHSLGFIMYGTFNDDRTVHEIIAQIRVTTWEGGGRATGENWPNACERTFPRIGQVSAFGKR